MIGEFPAASLNGGLTDTQLYEYALAAGFDGGWGWALNGGGGISNLSPAMAAIRSRCTNFDIILIISYAF